MAMLRRTNLSRFSLLFHYCSWRTISRFYRLFYLYILYFLSPEVVAPVQKHLTNILSNSKIIYTLCASAHTKGIDPST